MKGTSGEHRWLFETMAESSVSQPILAEHDIEEYNVEDNRIPIPDEKGFSWRKLWAFMGPGFLVSIAYIDPGNFATDIEAGSKHQYTLLWVLLSATLLGLALQVLAARLGLVSGKNLAQLCREQYPPWANNTMWLLTEIAIIASDIPEVLGTAIALQLLTAQQFPLWAGVVLTSLDCMLLLAVTHFGFRWLEVIITALLMIVATGFVVELFMVDVNPLAIVKGTFVPIVESSPPGALYIAMSLLGAVVMPHNLYLHSALVQSRKVPRKRSKISEALKYNAAESAFALLISLFINIAIVVVAASTFSPSFLECEKNRHGDPSIDCGTDLYKASNLLGHLLKNAKVAQIIFGVALFCSGQSSTITGTYAGQFVMEGFLNLKIRPWVRNLLTRSVAIIPSLAVSLIAGARGATSLMVFCSVILSFQLPFALIPMVKFSASPTRVGNFALTTKVWVATAVVTVLLIVTNVYLVVQTLIDAVNDFTVSSRVLVLLVAVVVGILYFLFLGYLCLREVQAPRVLSSDYLSCSDHHDGVVVDDDSDDNERQQTDDKHAHDSDYNARQQPE